MTDREAVEIIKVARAEVEWEYPIEYAAAFDRAVKALERESCEDAISRQAVLDLCDSKDPEYKTFHLKEDVECLPSVIPKSGWIPVGRRLPKEGGKYICWFKEQKRDIVTMVAWQPRLRSWNLTGNMAYWKVFAWMPLPQPYKADSGE